MGEAFTIGRITSTKPLFRYYLRRQPRDKAMAAVEQLVDVFLPWHRRLRASRIKWFLLCRISLVTTYYTSAPDLDEAGLIERASIA